MNARHHERLKAALVAVLLLTFLYESSLCGFQHALEHLKASGGCGHDHAHDLECDAAKTPGPCSDGCQHVTHRHEVLVPPPQKGTARAVLPFLATADGRFVDRLHRQSAGTGVIRVAPVPAPPDLLRTTVLLI